MNVAISPRAEAFRPRVALFVGQRHLPAEAGLQAKAGGLSRRCAKIGSVLTMKAARALVQGSLARKEASIDKAQAAGASTPLNGARGCPKASFGNKRYDPIGRTSASCHWFAGQSRRRAAARVADSAPRTRNWSGPADTPAWFTAPGRRAGWR